MIFYLVFFRRFWMGPQLLLVRQSVEKRISATSFASIFFVACLNFKNTENKKGRIEPCFPPLKIWNDSDSYILIVNLFCRLFNFKNTENSEGRIKPCFPLIKIENVCDKISPCLTWPSYSSWSWITIVRKDGVGAIQIFLGSSKTIHFVKYFGWVDE